MFIQIIIGGFFLAIFGGFLWLAILRYQWRVRFNRRPEMALTEVHNKFFPSLQFENFAPIWLGIGKALGVDSRRLRPSDRFNIELAAVNNLYNPIDDLSEYGEAIAYELGIEWRPADLQTLGDFVHALTK